MALISEGINNESKKTMLTILEQKKEEANMIRESIKKEANKLVEDNENISPFSIHSIISQIDHYNFLLSKLEGKMELLELYSVGIEENKKENK